MNPESALRKANHKFTARFNQLEVKMQDEGKAWSELDIDQLEARWQAIKALPEDSGS